MELFGEMQKKGIAPNVITYSAVIEACGYGHVRCLELVREGLGQGCWADVVRGSKGTKPVAIDLHGCSVNVSKAIAALFVVLVGDGNDIFELWEQAWNSTIRGNIR